MAATADWEVLESARVYFGRTVTVMVARGLYQVPSSVEPFEGDYDDVN